MISAKHGVASNSCCPVEGRSKTSSGGPAFAQFLSDFRLPRRVPPYFGARFQVRLEGSGVILLVRSVDRLHQTPLYSTHESIIDHDDVCSNMKLFLKSLQAEAPRMSPTNSQK